jgi:aryl-alcohol dehydrogenase-like predicted oxidoreductase
MEKRELGHTGLMVSPICIGAWQLAGPLTLNGQPDGHPDPGREHVVRLVRQLGDEGINCIDTAEQYGDGESERRVGEAVAGCRDAWVISTKFGYRVGPGGTRADDAGAHTIMSSLEGSLGRLATDHIDIYLYHCAPALDDLEAGREVLETARDQGKIRCYGISTNDVAMVQAMLDLDMLDVLQCRISLLQQEPAIRNLLCTHRIGSQVRGVMEQGRLSGKYFRGQPVWPADDNRSRNGGGEDYTRYAVLGELVPEGYTMAQVAIRWVLDWPCTHTVCLGAKTLEDYRVALQAAHMAPLDDEVRHKLHQCAVQLGGRK